MKEAGVAIEKSSLFTFNGSLAKGRSMTDDLAKLMLRAYNAESENVVRALRTGNSITAVKRLEAARAAIAKLGRMMEMRISDSFHALRIEEVELTADYWIKKEEEQEAARAERERLREEREVEAELAAARERLDKERTHLNTVMEKLKVDGIADPELERKLAEVDSAIAQNDYRAANIRAGYVYFSEDAVKLENELHQHFAAHRVNWVNNRREFFFATPGEVRSVLAEKLGNLLEFAESVASTEYLQSVRYWPQGIRLPGPASASNAA